MTTDEAVQKIKDIAHKHRNDPEAAHIHADKLLCEILRKTGYYRTADLFERMTKYYG